jgi:hypothetical protein
MVKPMINLHVVVDADLVLQRAPGSGAGGAVTRIPQDHAVMVVTGAAAATMQGPGDIAFDTDPDAAVRMFVTSGSNNFEHAVLLRHVHHVGGDEVLRRLRPVTEDRIGVAPASPTSVLPAQHLSQRFSFHHGDIAGEGIGNYRLGLELWDRDTDGQPRIAGNYQWDSQIAVRFV